MDRTDSERLDWLENAARFSGGDVKVGSYMHGDEESFMVQCPGVESWQPTLRQAIDAAMEAEHDDT